MYYIDLGSLVKSIDKALVYEGFLGEGISGCVVKVRKGRSSFALKIKSEDWSFLIGDRKDWPFRVDRSCSSFAFHGLQEFGKRREW